MLRSQGKSRMWNVAALRQAILCLLAVPVLTVSAVLHAQTYLSPADEYAKRIRVTEELDPLGEGALGDHINLYDGTLNFSNVDVRETGLGPDIYVARRFTIPDENTGVAFHPFHSNAFVDWDIDIPSIDTLSAPTKIVTNGNVTWQWYLVDDYYGQVRCSGLGQAPSMYVGTGANIATYTSDQWWHGYHLNTPDGTQTVLRRASANSQTPSITDDSGHVLSFPLVTKEHWAIGCLASTSNGVPGEGYLAVSPAGVKYYLDVVVQRSADAVMASAGLALKRKLVRFLPSKVVDRFGNAVTYTYDANGNLIAMQAGDGGSGNGRRVELTWEQWQAPTNDPGPSTSPTTQYTSFRVTKVTEQPSAAAPRVWTYTYSSDPLIPRLTKVTLPDGTTWSYDLGGLPPTNADSLISYTGAQGTCNYLLFPNTATRGNGTITGPSGLTGTFVAQTAIRGRSKVPVACSNVHVNGVLPRVYAVTSILSKTLSGPGMVSQAWAYSYGPTNESWLETCSSCQTTVTTTVSDPSGNSIVRTFSNAFDSTESLLLTADAYTGSPSGVPMQHETRTYATTGPWPSPIGASNELGVNESQVGSMAVPASTALSESDGDMYSWSATAFDAFGHATALTKSSNTNPTALNETIGYINDQAPWVLGLQASTTNAANGEVMWQTAYTAGDVPSDHYVFGRKSESYGFDSHGQLTWLKDGLGNTTTFTQQVRGIPTQVGYPDQTAETFGLNEFGEVSSYTDRSGHIVAYGYDGVGRVNREQRSGADFTWDPVTIQYAAIAAPERGIAAGHFRRTWTQGDHVRTTYYDARLQPILADEFRASDGGLRSSSRIDFDWRGHKTKEYRPLAGASSLSDFGKGTATNYDALGRVASVVIDTELQATPTATTSTAYLSGGRLQVTDPNGIITVSGYQMFDTPDYTANISLASSGVTQTTVRDVYGNVVRIDQSGDVSTSKSFAYDSHYQLCRITEPESGSYIAAYDDAGNISWSAKGVAYSSSGDEHDCGQSAVQASQKITRSYDPANRLASVTYADGSPTDSFEYTGTGLMARSSSGGTVRTFSYNSLDKISSEQLAIDGLNWNMGYSYTSFGALSAMTYPDGTVAAMQPDALGRQTAVASLVNGAQYFPDGKLASFTFGSGQAYSAAENDRGFLSTFEYGSGSSQPVAEDFVYDLLGRVQQVGDVSGATTRNKQFSYDSLNRLASATDTPVWGGDIYAYNALGDITSIKNGSTTSTFQYASNKLVNISTAGSTLGYAFDAQGNMTQRGSDTYIFDQAGRLSAIPGKASYAYDGLGIRAKTLLASGDATYYLYSRGGLLLMTYSSATGNVIDHFYLGSKPVATQTNLAAPISGPALTVPASGTAGTPFTVTWSAVAHATSYTIQQSVAGSAFSTLSTQATTSLSVTAATAGSYAYRVQACNAGGCGPWSSVASLTVNAPPQAPPSPATVSATAAGDLSSIGITWAASTGASNYVVQYRVVGGSWATLITTSSLATALSNPPDAAYQFQVEACAAPGCSAWTGSATVTIRHLPTTPATINVPSTNAGSLTISWAASSYASSYTLEKGVGGSYAGYVTTAATSAGVSLPTSGTYTFRVMACNDRGCSGYSPVGQTQTTIVPASAPAISTSGNSSSGAFSVSWNAVNDGASYTLQEQINGGSWATVQNAAATSWSTSGRGNGTYGYRVQACNASGCGPWSGTASLSVSLIPATPGYVTLTQSGPSNKRSTTATWAAVANATSYQLQETVAPGGSPTVVYNGSGTSYIERALGVTGTLSFHVMACNATGCSAYGPTSSIQVINGN
jgi:YD repeat-containing protein